MNDGKRSLRRLQRWLRAEATALRTATFSLAPNLLPIPQDLDDWLVVLTNEVGQSPDHQLATVQAWVHSYIGDDPPLANDWLTLMRILKREVGRALDERFSARAALSYWRSLDPLFNHAFIEIARLVAETDRAVHLEYMVDLRAQLERLNRSKSDFVAVAAHELKTPLTLLEGYANMIAAELPEDVPHLEQYLAGLHDGTRRLRAIVEDLLDVTLVEAESLDLAYQPVYLHQLLNLVVDRKRPAFRERNVSLTLEPVPIRDPIYADPERLSQVFGKLLENALKFTPDGRSVRIECEVVGEGPSEYTLGAFVAVRFVDTGIGIDADELNTIFEKFSTTQNVDLHSSGKTKFKGGGPGLGLPIVKGLVEAHGGRVWAESPGFNEETCPGSTFHVELPLRRQPPAE